MQEFEREPEKIVCLFVCEITGSLKTGGGVGMEVQTLRHHSKRDGFIYFKQCPGGGESYD